jgi:GH24 family phage-related lysozyme (muramidase)
MNTLSSDGLDLIKTFEGFREEAYRCEAGVDTIGFGHTGNVEPGDRISLQQATQLLAQDTDWAEQAVRDNVKAPLSQQQFDALTSFVFNVGEGAFESSTLLDKLNAGDYAGAQAEFGRWNKAAGKVSAGLERRRQEEAAMFGGDAPEGVAPAATASALAPSFPPSSNEGGATHAVRPNDTLYDIAREHGLPLAALIAANPQISDPDLIVVGQQIRLPPAAAASTASARDPNELLRQALSLGH